MKQLYDLLLNIEIIETLNYKNSLINKLSFNSRDNLDHAIFFAIRGVNVDGHDYIEQAIAKGAVAIVVEKLPIVLNPNICYVLVKDSNYTLGIIASVFYDKPSDYVKVIGITGTNGKTTTATLLYKLLMGMGYNVGLISTVAIYINEEKFDTTHTTPDQITLQYYLNLMERRECEYCIMEVSSHSVVQHRIAGINFLGGIFTNITRDHLDYHKTFDNYLQAKKMFFDNLGANAFALSNKDDNHGMYVLQNTKAKQFLYSLNSISDFRFKVLENTVDGMLLNIDNIEFYSKLSGVFNAYNLLAVYSVCRILNKDKNNVLKYLSALEPVQGRFEKVISAKNKVAVVDYAHTPDAVSNILESINATKGGNQNLITVIGCGGNRDKGKRPEMARIACEKSNKVIFTSDNPRFENPEDIINDMLSGIKNLGMDSKYITIVDRREAIKTACVLSGDNDIILVAGKGHETYQEINGIKHDFNDKEVLKEFINL